MSNFKKIYVHKQQAGWRLDKLISYHYPCNRSQAEKLIKQKQISCSDSTMPLKPGLKVKLNQCYTLYLNLKEEDPKVLWISENNQKEILSHQKTLNIVYEDEHILVLDKPASLVVHPGAGKEEVSLVHILKLKLSPELLEESPLRPGVVHRLDKGVSGLMLFAKNLHAKKKLIDQFKQKKIKRQYRALVIGKARETKGKIESWMGRHPKNRKKFHSFHQYWKGSKKAITYYQILSSFQSQLHHIQCQLDTGRTHQIRIHLSHIGLPILGENVYSSFQKQKKTLNAFSFKKNSLAFNRLALYSADLKFLHPATGKRLAFSLNWPVKFHLLFHQVHFNPRFE